MKRSDLSKLLYQYLGYWKIVNIGYEDTLKHIVLLLQEHIPNGNDKQNGFKSLNSFKKLIVLDEFAFNYYEDGVLINSLKQFLVDNKGVNLQQLDLIISDPSCLKTTAIQTEWLKVLKNLDLFDIDTFKEVFILELQNQLAYL